MNQSSNSSHNVQDAPAIVLGSSTHQLLLAKFTVSDLPCSFTFYTELIGLQVALAPGQPPPSAQSLEAASQAAFVEIPMNFSGTLADPFFVLVKQRDQIPSSETARLSWIGFKVPAVRNITEKVREAGYRIVREPFEAGTNGPFISIFCDPDGYTVELIETHANS